MHNPLTELAKAARSLEALLSYVKTRLSEKSTWAGIVGGLSGASALTHPWDYLSALGGAIMVLIPTKTNQTDSPSK